MRYRYRPLLFTLGAVISLGAVGYGLYQYQTDKALKTRVSELQNEIQNIRTVQENASTTTPAPRSATQPTAVVANAPAPTLTSAVAKVGPAVVSIVIYQDVPQLKVSYVNPFGNDDPFGLGFSVPVYTKTGSTTREKVAAGTGFLIRSDGYILTNRHVVSLKGAYYTVLLSTGAQKEATVVYRDPIRDLAVLKIDGNGLPTVMLGDSSKLELGQTVAAIGNSLGQYNNSVSVGVISGLNRTVEASDDQGTVEQLSGMIQTDAAINLGNSGGPLLDLAGKVVAVNVATAVGANNVSFAIPINDVLKTIRAALP